MGLRVASTNCGTVKLRGSALVKFSVTWRWLMEAVNGRSFTSKAGFYKSISRRISSGFSLGTSEWPLHFGITQFVASLLSDLVGIWSSLSTKTTGMVEFKTEGLLVAPHQTRRTYTVLSTKYNFPQPTPTVHTDLVPSVAGADAYLDGTQRTQTTQYSNPPNPIIVRRSNPNTTAAHQTRT